MREQPSPRVLAGGLLLLSAATLAFEVNLTRLFSVSQFYHFAFMIVSLALLGLGASGTWLALFPRVFYRPTPTLTLLSWGTALTMVGSYTLINRLPFDSFRVTLDPEQWGVLALHYLALATPFLCAGAATGLLLTVRSQAIGPIYGANLSGSAIGCLLAILLPPLVGGEGGVFITASLAGLAGLVFLIPPRTRTARLLAGLTILLTAACAIIARRPPPLHLSPYKGLSYALQYPDARLVLTAWNGVSRVDVVEAAGIRSLPGQGFACRGEPPPQRGLFVDGNDQSPITQVSDPADLRPLTDCLLTSLPYRLRPGARALVIEPRGGFDVLVSLAEGAGSVTGVESNPLVAWGVQAQEEWGGNPYGHSGVRLVIEDGRAFLARPGPSYDLILLSLTTTYHPTTSGAYSLAEDYRYTVEGFTAALERLDEGGILAFTRWLQVPPSESLRAMGLAVEGLERVGEEPDQCLAALRSYNQMLILARRGPFTPEELETVRSFAAARSFDLVYLPDIRPDEVNQHNILPAPDYYMAFGDLLRAGDRAAWLDAYPFDITPPTDDHPFFGHFFRWRQIGEVVEMAGHVWQPFGGAGYLVLLALLPVSAAAAGLTILLPLISRRRTSRGLGACIPFGFLGLGYLFVELPLLQRFILFLGYPAAAMAVVLGTLLLFSGLGSLLSARVRFGPAMAGLVGLVLLYRLGLPLLSGPLLALPFPARVGLTIVSLALPGTLMGVPFPSALSRMRESGLIPWAWGVNGAASVVASVLAAILALSWGLGQVLILGALCYLGAWVTTAWASG